MEHQRGKRWEDVEAAGRYTRDTAAYPTALAWLGVLLGGLTLAGLAAYRVYLGFGSVYGD